MRFRLLLIMFAMAAFSCTRDRSVHISGRVENGDSIVSIRVKDSIYSFALDENNFFSGNIVMDKSGYATLLHNSLNLYLSPGEDLQIYVNALNFSSSLYFRGSLGGINSYMKEQEVAVFFDKDYYSLGEEEFVSRMKALIDEKTELLEAKNFDDRFTALEKERIRYSVAERVSFYPIFRKKMYPDQEYRPGKVFTDFISSFALDNEALYNTRDYRSFLLNYVYLQAGLAHQRKGNFSDGIADYILSTISDQSIKDFLLTEIVYRYIWENNGLDGASYLLKVFRKECSDRRRLAYMEEIIGNWEKILPGQPAPDFLLEDQRGKKYSLEDFEGAYVYLTVWATWCVPCKSELPHLAALQKEYAGRNIRFLTVAIGDTLPETKSKWKNFLKRHPYPGLHTYADGSFNKEYMIISVPRFILIGPDGSIIDSNAPRPSGQMRQMLDGLDI